MSKTKTERAPMGVHIALSAAQLKSAGVPEWMTEDELAECVDDALLTDDSQLARAVADFIYERAIDEHNESVRG
jgi:ADP-ribosylglycohydrolase